MTTHELSESSLQKLQRILNGEPAEELTPEEIQVLREMIVAWRGLTAMGWLAGALRRWLWVVGVAVGLYFAWHGKPDIVESIVNGPPK